MPRDVYEGRSQYILKRLMLLRTLDAPTISDVKVNFGPDLAEKIFCNCDSIFREDIGLEPPLKGPLGGDLWSSPSDILIGKLCLKPPMTSTHIRALTHQGILDIGMKVEQLFWNEVEIEKSKELSEQEKILKLLFETTKHKAIVEAEQKMLESFAEQRLELVNEMDAVCKLEMRQMSRKYYQDLQDELKEQAKILEQMYETKLAEEMNKHSASITIQSSTNLHEIETEMQKAFQTQVQKAELRARFEVQKENIKIKDKLKVLRHEHECKNLANMMYLVCMERKKCASEKSAIEEKLQREIQELEEKLKTKNEELTKVVTEKDQHKTEVELREKALLEIITEFQKFINFALKAVPKQAEYLLCAEKLMIFELTEALSKIEKPAFDEHDQNYVWARSPPRSDSTGSSLNVSDAHNCLEEPELSMTELSPEQFLPGFFYNDQLFVREDFRDMIANGIKVDQDNMLWTKHVQDVTDYIEQSCFSRSFDEGKEPIKTRYIAPEKRSVTSYHSSVHFSSKGSNQNKNTRRKSSLKQVNNLQAIGSIDFARIGSEENRRTLISAKNSMELIRERSSIVKKSNTKSLSSDSYEKKPETSSLVGKVRSKTLVEAKDSILHTKIHNVVESMTEIRSVNKQESNLIKVKPTSSKLLHANDSLTILKTRQSINLSKIHLRTSIPEEIKCLRPDCNILQYDVNLEKTSEKTFESIISPKISVEEPKNRLYLRRISIAHDDADDEIDSKELINKKIEIRKPTTPKRSPRKIKRIHQTKRIPISTSTKVVPQKDDKEKEPIMPERKIVAGDSKLKFYDQSDEKFLNDRVQSFINIIKEHPNLIRLFTSVTR